MPVHLKIIPPVAERPAVPEVGRWRASLVLFIAVAVTVGLYLDKQAEGTRFWMLVPVVLCFAWFTICLLVWASFDNRASSWDKTREDVLLREFAVAVEHHRSCMQE